MLWIKLFQKIYLLKNNIRTPKFFSIKLNEFKLRFVQSEIKNKKIKFPIVVKPISEGSSIGVKVCKNYDSLFKQAKFLFQKYKTLIFEEYIGGQEIQVAVINGKPLGSNRINSKRKFYDYKAKYTKQAKTKHVMPAGINKKKYSEVLILANKAHNALNCRGNDKIRF